MNREKNIENLKEMSKAYCPWYNPFCRSKRAKARRQLKTIEGQQEKEKKGEQCDE